MITEEIDNKLVKIIQYSTQKGIIVEITEHGGKNRIEETIRHGEKIIEMSIGDASDENLLDLLDCWIERLEPKESS